MGFLMLHSDGGTIYLRVPRQPRQDVIREVVADPSASRVHPLHDRSHIRRDMPHVVLPLKGTRQ